MAIEMNMNKRRKRDAPRELITIATKMKYRRQYDNLGKNVKPTFHLNCDDKFHCLYNKSIIEVQEVIALVTKTFRCLHRKTVAAI